jgi:hypothetical protein
MFERSPFIGFVRWIIYWVVADGPSTWMFGAICAVIATLILGVSAGRAGPRLLEVVTIVFFIGMTIAGMVVGAQDRDWMDTYATTLSSGALAVMALGSLAFEPSPRSTRLIVRHNTIGRRRHSVAPTGVLTLMWALVFTLIAVHGYVAVRSPGSVHWTKAVIPVVVLVGAMGMTQIYPTRAWEGARPA